MLDFIKEALPQEFAAGRLVVLEAPDPFLDLLGARFPMGLNRIAWEKVPGHHRLSVWDGGRDIESRELGLRLAKCRVTMQEWLSEVGHHTADDSTSVVWLGDMTDVGLEFSCEKSVELFPVLSSFPQHSYVLPRDGSWCLNYVMEGELFFGRAP